MTCSQTRIAELESRIAELEKENEKLKEKTDTDEDTDDDPFDEYFFSDTHNEVEYNEEVECNDKKFKVSAIAYVLMQQWQLDAEDIEEITGTGKGGVIVSRDLKVIIEATKEAWMAEEDTDDEDEDDK